MMEEDLVYVSQQNTPGSEPALAAPVFVIEHQGKLYLTRAIWEYAESPDASDTVKDGVAQMRALFEANVSPDIRTAAIPPLPPTVIFELSSPKPEPDGDA